MRIKIVEHFTYFRKYCDTQKNEFMVTLIKSLKLVNI